MVAMQLVFEQRMMQLKVAFEVTVRTLAMARNQSTVTTLVARVVERALSKLQLGVMKLVLQLQHSGVTMLVTLPPQARGVTLLLKLHEALLTRFGVTLMPKLHEDLLLVMTRHEVTLLLMLPEDLLKRSAVKLLLMLREDLLKRSAVTLMLKLHEDLLLVMTRSEVTLLLLLLLKLH
jgi:hypothetical protein